MSEERAIAIQALSAAFDRRDEQAFLDHFAADAELLDRLSLNPNVYRGREAIGAWFRGWDKVWDDVHGSFVEVLYDSGEVVLWRSAARARGKTSGVEISQSFWHVARFRGGVIAQIEHHRSQAEALEAAGLSN